MPELLQDAVVTMVALGALVILLRRVFTIVKPTGGTGCASCPSAVKRPTTNPEPTLTAEPRPLTLFTSRPSSR